MLYFGTTALYWSLLSFNLALNLFTSSFRSSYDGSALRLLIPVVTGIGSSGVLLINTVGTKDELNGLDLDIEVRSELTKLNEAVKQSWISSRYEYVIDNYD